MTKKHDGHRRPPGRDDPTRPSSAAGRRRKRTAEQFEPEAPEVVFDVQLLDGPEGEALAQQQARVLREVTEWLAQNSSASGRTTNQ
ncbi:hypothetical protein [Actinophytocola oryzae]|uniref:hypothetical protein n=1 Tax=Actinophytocola oryzae TaxID=502181 RepID=UPI0010631E8F|nr:hypothetical protein [Actinophytocola oryzae]